MIPSRLCLLLLVGCGRVGFDAVPVDAPPPDAAPSLGAISDTLADSPGRPTQTHLVYAATAATWWQFYVGIDTTILHAAYRASDGTWIEATSLTLAQPLVSGANFSVATKTIAGRDVVHIALAYLDNRAEHAHVRAELSPSSIAWGTETTVGCVGAFTAAENGPIDGPVVVVGHDNIVYDFTSAWNDDNTCTGNTYVGNFDVTFANDPDTGDSWASNWQTPNYLLFVPRSVIAHWGAPTVDGALTIGTDGQDLAGTVNFLWSLRTAGTWSTPVDVLPTALPQLIDPDDWSAVRISDTNHLLVARTSDASYLATRFDGAAWSPLPAIPVQPSLTGGGLFLATDGATTWLFVIENPAIRFTRFDGTGWSAWTTLDLPAATRLQLAGNSTVVDGTVGLQWSEPSGGGFQLVTAIVPLP